MSYQFYKCLHVLGILLVFMSFGGILAFRANGGEKKDNKARKLIAISHGIGLFLILLSGFGLLARLGLTSEYPTWVIIKLLIWIVAGALIALLYRLKLATSKLWVVCVALGLFAVYVANYHPM
jgi:hypothetical protein